MAPAASIDHRPRLSPWQCTRTVSAKRTDQDGWCRAYRHRIRNNNTTQHGAGVVPSRKEVKGGDSISISEHPKCSGIKRAWKPAGIWNRTIIISSEEESCAKEVYRLDIEARAKSEFFSGPFYNFKSSKWKFQFLLILIHVNGFLCHEEKRNFWKLKENPVESCECFIKIIKYVTLKKKNICTFYYWTVFANYTWLKFYKNRCIWQRQGVRDILVVSHGPTHK